MSSVRRPAKRLGLVKVEGEEEEEAVAPDSKVQEAIGRYVQRASSQNAASGSGAAQGRAGSNSGAPPSKPAPAGALTTPQPPTRTSAPHSSVRRLLDPTQGLDSGGDTEDDEDKYEMMSRGTLKAKSQALVEVIQGVKDAQIHQR